jgi:hypothetical protein
VAISSANIPAVSFVITAIMPARGHQWNEAIDSPGPELPITSVKEPDQTMAHHSPALLQLIRNCKKEHIGCD